VSFAINDHSYIFSETSYAERERYVDEAATELLDHVIGPKVDAPQASRVFVSVNYELQLDKLTWAWMGETTIKMMDSTQSVLLLEDAKEGEFVFYRSIPNTSESTQYHIIFNTMADCMEKMLPAIRKTAEALSSGQAIALSNFRTSDASNEGGNGQTTLEKADDFSNLTERELNDEFEYIKHIAKKRDPGRFKKIGIEDKRQHLRTFWAQFSKDTTVIENEYRLDYLDRVRYANSAFGEGVREGWESERGRVLLVYGRPDQIERFPSNSGQKAYEIWYYHAFENGAEFCFVDVSGMGQLKLVHSTARGELRDDRWQRLLAPGRSIF
jgi:GWxTD domain-containing protein